MSLSSLVWEIDDIIAREDSRDSKNGSEEAQLLLAEAVVTCVEFTVN